MRDWASSEHKSVDQWDRNARSRPGHPGRTLPRGLQYAGTVCEWSVYKSVVYTIQYIDLIVMIYLPSNNSEITHILVLIWDWCISLYLRNLWMWARLWWCWLLGQHNRSTRCVVPGECRAVWSQWQAVQWGGSVWSHIHPLWQSQV